MSFQLAARVLTLPIKPAPKIILLAYADAANDDGTGAWPAPATLAQYAQCDGRTVRRHRDWLITHGYLREGDQSHPSLIKYPRDCRPICYDVAVDEPQRYAWEQQRAAGSRGRRDQFAEAGRKGNEARAVKMSARAGANSGEVVAEVAASSATAPEERADNGDRPGRTVMTAKPTHLTYPQPSVENEPTVDMTHVVVADSVADTKSDVVQSEDAEDAQPAKVIEFPYKPCRLKGMTDARKTQRLTGEWISVLGKYGFEASEDQIREVGRAIKDKLAAGCADRKLIDLVRRDAVQQVERVRENATAAKKRLADGLVEVGGHLGDLSDEERGLATQTLSDGHPVARAVQVVQALRDKCPYDCTHGTWIDAGSLRDCPKHAEVVARSMILAGYSVAEVERRTGIERRTIELAERVATAPPEDSADSRWTSPRVAA